MTVMEERLVNVAAHAAVVFGGNAAVTLRWLEMPQAALDDDTPASLLITDYGFSRVVKLLVQLERVSSIAA